MQAPDPTVNLIGCTSYDAAVLEPAVDRLLAPWGGLAALVEPGDRVVLKPNLIAALPPERAATTHPALLEALLTRLLALGAQPAIADAPAWGTPQAVAEATGVLDLSQRYDIPFWFLDRHTTLPSRHPEVASRFHVDPRIAEAAVVINVAKLKSHQQLGFTAAMKNLYGCLAGREKAWHHCRRSRTDAEFARYLVAYQAALPVQLHVVDGILAMDGPGPRLGRARPVGVLAASRSSVAVDLVAAEVIDAPARCRLLLEAARELGLPPASLAEVPLLGDALDSLRVDDFLHPDLIGVFFSPQRVVRGWWRNYRAMRAEQGSGAIGW